jgi:hypothetical protein
LKTDQTRKSASGLASIIIVNYNGKHLLTSCLEAILRQEYKNFEVIVVDNGSSDGSVHFIQEQFSWVRLITLEKNTGFTGGNIEGMRHANGEWIVLLNNDALLCTDWLGIMISALESGPELGLCASRLVIEGTHLLDAAGDAFTTAFSGTKVGERHDFEEYGERRLVPGACAAAAIYRRSMLDDIGFLDEDFFLNHEDTDLNMRAWLSGWKCLYVPEAMVWHKVSSTIGRMSDTSVYYFARNSLWVWIKNTPTFFMLRYLHHRILYEFSSFFLFCFVMGKWRPFLKGKFHSLLGIPKMARKRKMIQCKVRLEKLEIWSELIPITAYLVERLRMLQRSGRQ